MDSQVSACAALTLIYSLIIYDLMKPIIFIVLKVFVTLLAVYKSFEFALKLKCDDRVNP